MNEEDMYIMLSNLEEELRRIRVALETIAQSLNHEELTVQAKPSREEIKQAWESYKELLTALKEIAPTLASHIKNAKRFSTGNYLIQIDSVDKETYKKILAEGLRLGGSYSRKYHGFIFKGKKAKE